MLYDVYSMKYIKISLHKYSDDKFILGLTNQKYAKLLRDRYVIYSLLESKQLYRSSPGLKF